MLVTLKRNTTPNYKFALVIIRIICIKMPFLKMSFLDGSAVQIFVSTVFFQPFLRIIRSCHQRWRDVVGLLPHFGSFPFHISRNVTCVSDSFILSTGFYFPGEYERKLGLPVTPNCDRNLTSVAKIQTGDYSRPHLHQFFKGSRKMTFYVGLWCTR